MLPLQLTSDEIRFLDQMNRELWLGAGVATQQLHDRGIYYTHEFFGSISYLWDRDWMSRNQEFPYPRQDDLEVVCPWESKEALEFRVKELTAVVQP